MLYFDPGAWIHAVIQIRAYLVLISLISFLLRDENRKNRTESHFSNEERLDIFDRLYIVVDSPNVRSSPMPSPFGLPSIIPRDMIGWNNSAQTLFSQRLVTSYNVVDSAYRAGTYPSIHAY